MARAEGNTTVEISKQLIDRVGALATARQTSRRELLPAIVELGIIALLHIDNRESDLKQLNQRGKLLADLRAVASYQGRTVQELCNLIMKEAKDGKHGAIHSDILGGTISRTMAQTAYAASPSSATYQAIEAAAPDEDDPEDFALLRWEQPAIDESTRVFAKVKR